MAIDQEVVQATTKLTEITLAALIHLIQRLVENKYQIAHGKQSMEQLNRQNKQLESVKITQPDINAFRKELNRYYVDCAFKKDWKTGEYTIFFKAQDVDRVYAGLENCIKGLNIDRSNKRPINDVMREAEAKAKERAEQQPPERNRTTDRGERA